MLIVWICTMLASCGGLYMLYRQAPYATREVVKEVAAVVGVIVLCTTAIISIVAVITLSFGS